MSHEHEAHCHREIDTHVIVTHGDGAADRPSASQQKLFDMTYMTLTVQ